MADEHSEKRLTRRQTIGLAGAAGGALVLGGAAGRALSGDGGSEMVSQAEAAKACRLTPETTEGPFYVALDRIRQDITEGTPGVPLTLRIRVVDVARCRPVRKAAVDIWHCNASGRYSDEASNGTAGQTFLRGVQLTNKKGFATFQTVYPGHYIGRATHIHLKVHIGSRAAGGTLRGGHVCHTGQLFFDENANNNVYALSSYGSAAGRTLNSQDGIYAQAGGSSAIVRLSGSPQAGFVGTIVVGVKPGATPTAA